jgi:hypothetical protein
MKPKSCFDKLEHVGITYKLKGQSRGLVIQKNQILRTTQVIVKRTRKKGKD